MKKLGLLLLLVFVFLPVPTVSAGDEDDWIFCSLTDSSNSTVYFSGVFQGDYSWSIRYENAFHDYVHAKYDDVIGLASCFFEGDQKAARAELYDHMASKRRVYDEIVETSWSY